MRFVLDYLNFSQKFIYIKSRVTIDALGYVLWLSMLSLRRDAASDCIVYIHKRGLLCVTCSM